jgi:uncharacterized membrane protein
LRWAQPFPSNRLGPLPHEGTNAPQLQFELLVRRVRFWPGRCVLKLLRLVATDMSSRSDSFPRPRIAMRWAMAAFYLSAGAVHLLAPEKFLPIVPDFVPMPREVVLATGVCEIAGSLALLTRRLRRLAGVMLALYAVCVFPVNIKHAIEGVNLPPVPDSWWYHGPRLLMQPVLVWWALFCAGVIDWPRREKATAPNL